MRSKQQAYTHVVRVRETSHFPVVESKATAGKPWWNTRHDVTGSDFHYLPPYYSLAVPNLSLATGEINARGLKCAMLRPFLKRPTADHKGLCQLSPSLCI